MAFVLQGNTPVVGANAYIDAAYFTTYHTDRGIVVSLYSTADIQFAIVRATSYVDVRFTYVGQRITPTQEREWPRQFAVDNNGYFVTGLPTALKSATAEYALRALVGFLMPDPLLGDTSGFQIRSKEEAVGPIISKIEYERNADYVLPDYPVADRLLVARGLVSNGAIGGSRNGLQVGNLGRS